MAIFASGNSNLAIVSDHQNELVHGTDNIDIAVVLIASLFATVVVAAFAAVALMLLLLLLSLMLLCLLVVLSSL